MKAIGVERTLPATWRLPRLTAGHVAFVGVVTLLTMLLLMRLAEAFTTWDGADFQVYVRAASSWAHAGNPYLYDGTRGADSYRYAPWFAGAWIPFIGLPHEPLLVAWTLILLAATAAVMIGLIRDHGWRALPLALLGGSLLVSLTAGANVQAILIAGLYFTLHRRSGPVWVGVAASLKIFPILYVIPWIGRGEWRKAATAVGVMVALYAPILLFAVPPVATDPGGAYWPSPLLWLGVGGASLIAAVWLARTRYAWAAAGAAAVLCIPRLLALDLSMILPAARPEAARKTP